MISARSRSVGCCRRCLSRSDITLSNINFCCSTFRRRVCNASGSSDSHQESKEDLKIFGITDMRGFIKCGGQNLTNHNKCV